jgi:hypothetical protein
MRSRDSETYNAVDLRHMLHGVDRKAARERLGRRRRVILQALDAELLDKISLEEPVLLVETMDQRIRTGAWPVLGKRVVAPSIVAPLYKVWVDPPGEFRTQDVKGNVGVVVSPEQASGMKHQKSFSPAVVEAAVLGLHGLGPWHPVYDELLV